MTSIMRGVRVLEVAAWTFVPAAGAILADWGADVLKVEHPETGDPQRGLATLGVLPGGGKSVSFMMQGPNRGKRSVAINIATDDGREVLYRLAETSDVFLTSYLPSVRERLRIDVDDIRARNEKIIYVRGHGQGAKGPERDKGGFDGASYWARGGVADTLTPPGAPQLVGARPGIGDVMGGLNLAGGISAALFSRERTGEGTVVDASLLNTAMWQLQTDIAMTSEFGLDDIVRFQGDGKVANPLVGNYRTKDDRWVFLNIMQSDRFWADFCRHLGRVDMVDDERFRDASARAEHSEACLHEIADTFASRTLSEWRDALATMQGVWAPVQRVPELRNDEQVIANGYLSRVTDADGSELDLVGAPVQFNEQPHELRPAPEHGQHTDEVLLELGCSWDEIVALKVSGAVG
ncbi:MAG: CoA transferase [Acidimicrobiia bacterium]|nr:CoA transferase [Acidimicrobiia bacterium]